MIHKLINVDPRRVFTVLLFAFPVFLGTVKSWHSALFLLMVLFGLFHVGQTWADWDRKTKIFFLSVACFLLFASLSLVNSADLHQGWKRLGKLSYLLGMFVLIFATFKHKIDLSRIYTKGIVWGGFCLGAVAVYQVLVLSKTRAQGITHPIVFGDVAMLFAMLLLVYLIFRPAEESVVWPALSLAAALVASLLSMSRGGWAVVPLLGVVAPFFLGKHLLQRRFLAVAGVTLVLALILSVSYGEAIYQRLDQSYANVVSFVEGENLNSSIGQRFLMWDIALEMFEENPLLGSGLGDFRHDSVAMMDAGTTLLQEEHGHAHSIYFEMLGTAGALGLLSMMLALIFVPLGCFFSFWRSAGNADQRRIAFSGLVAVFCFAVFGLSESWLSRSPFVVLYCVTVFVFYSAAYSQHEECQAEPSSERNEK